MQDCVECDTDDGHRGDEANCGKCASGKSVEIPEICADCQKLKKCENCRNYENSMRPPPCTPSICVDCDHRNENDEKQSDPTTAEVHGGVSETSEECNEPETTCDTPETCRVHCKASAGSENATTSANENPSKGSCATSEGAPCAGHCGHPQCSASKCVNCETFTRIQYCSRCGSTLTPPVVAAPSSSSSSSAAVAGKSISPTPMFAVTVVKQTVNSVTIDCNLMGIPATEVDSTDVYKIEKYHRRRGWERVAWTCENPVTIENLDENFAYRFRVSLLKYDPEREEYVRHKEATEFVASTQSALPSNISLLRAIKKGQQFLVKRILRRRPSLIEHPGPNGYLPLANAIIQGDICIVDVLLSAGASIHRGHASNQRTPLQLAFFHGFLPVARMLLNKRADLEATDMNGMTACHFAIDANQCEILKFALECGANMEASDACGWTLLLRAVVMRADVEILKLLVTSGAHLEAVDKFGQSCVDLARLYRNEPAMQYFRNNSKFKQHFK